MDGQEEFLYQIATPGNGQLITKGELEQKYVISGYEERECVRDELYGQPKLVGFSGPMWNGRKNGIPVIRYES
ncbi:hypothetical protein [Cohnella sp. AR92]|uniref:hypothetical protein n=1 Tax=Cohnella sp. AR92 TaxID=648716 RepID=UPI000F8CB3E1|nr:hypothetical protein [Cohnella sp. AR92]RUS44925.1 hypothetical protein ELR57_21965 [Cohnella sp. AR92]